MTPALLEELKIGNRVRIASTWSSFRGELAVIVQLVPELNGALVVVGHDPAFAYDPRPMFFGTFALELAE